MKKKSIALGVTSMILGAISFLTLFILVRVPWLAVEFRDPLKILLLIVLIFEILAIIIGIIAIISKKQKSRFGIAGIIIVVCSIVFVLMFGVTDGEISEHKGTITNDPAAKTSSTDVDNSDFAITKYNCGHDGADYTTYVLVIKNNSKETVDLHGTCTAYDSTGKKVDADSCLGDYCYAVAPSKSGCLVFCYQTVEPLNFIYSIEHSTSLQSNDVPLLKFEESQNGNNVVVTYTNNSNKSANDIRANIIFFNGDTPVCCKETNIPSTGSTEIKPGQHGSVKLESDQKFNNYKIFYESGTAGHTYYTESVSE